MKIICHRGLWLKKSEQNKIISFKRAFDKNFGVELDLRDYRNEIIISHDPYVLGKKITFNFFLKKFFNIINKKNILLALNIKSDGISKKIKKLIKKYKLKNYFVFDMSIPETFNYLRDNLIFFERYSNFEKSFSLSKYSKGFWVDSFDGKFILPKLYKNKICFVSPELHKKKNFKSLWVNLKKLKTKSNYYLCTDYPNLAKKFFND